MTISIIMNRIRTGKTLYLTGLIAKNKGQGVKIYSNYETRFTDTLVHSLADLEVMRQGFFALDDAYRWINSRRWKQNEAVDLIIAKSGKRRIDICMTCVRPMQIDKNVRDNVEYLYIPELFLASDGLPLIMIVRKFQFIPEAENFADSIGELQGEVIIRRRWLLKFISWYDTEEEIEELSVNAS